MLQKNLRGGGEGKFVESVAGTGGGSANLLIGHICIKNIEHMGKSGSVSSWSNFELLLPPTITFVNNVHILKDFIMDVPLSGKNSKHIDIEVGYPPLLSTKTPQI